MATNTATEPERLGTEAYHHVHQASAFTSLPLLDFMLNRNKVAY
jgi:hypothetical protein